MKGMALVTIRWICSYFDFLGQNKAVSAKASYPEQIVFVAFRVLFCYDFLVLHSEICRQ